MALPSLEIVGLDHGKAPPEETLEDLFDAGRNPVSRQGFGQRLAGEHLAVHEHPVAVENDQIEAVHRRPHAPEASPAVVLDFDHMIAAGATTSAEAIPRRTSPDFE